MQSLLLHLKYLVYEVASELCAKRIVTGFLSGPLNFVRLELVDHEVIERLLRIRHHSDEVLVHGRTEPLFVGVWRNDGWILIRQGLLQVAFQLLFKCVLLDVVNDAQSDSLLLWIDND